jgi:hypothetical protein
MSLTNNLGRLSAGLTADASLNIGVGVTPSGTYKFEVAGTGRFSTAATIGSTESIFNLASTNKLQLQNSMLVGYGTTATFLTMNLNYNSGWKYISNGLASIYSQDGGDHVFYTSTSSTAGAAATLNEKFRIANTGAATFSNSLQVNSYQIINGASAGFTFLQFSNNGTPIGYTGSAAAIVTGGSASDYALSTSQNITFATSGSFIERMRITSGGNVGIGTTSPSQPLHVYASSTTTSSFFETNSTNSYIGLKSTSGICYVGNVGYNMTFEAGGSERMRITSGGYIKASNTGSYGSTTSSSNEFNSNQADWTVVLRNTHASTPYGLYIEYVSSSPNVNGYEFLYFRDSSAIRFRVASNGNAYNTTGVYTTGASDIKYKEQIVDANSQWDDIKNLRVVNFKFKKDVAENGDNALKHIGFIAQEVEKTSPNLIEEMSDEKTGETWKTIKASIIHTKAIKALQETMIKVETLELQIKELQSQINK